MTSLFRVSGLIFVLILTGCTTQTERAGVNNKAASVANAELGVAYLAQGQNKVAMVKLKKAIAYDDENADAHHYIAELYRRLEQNDLSGKHFQKALELKSNDTSIKNNYAIYLCGIGDYDKGLSLLSSVLADPLYRNKDQAYENMGLCAEKQGNVHVAESYFLTALKLNRNLPNSLLGMAKIEFDKQNIQSATTYFERYNKIASHTPQSLWLGVLIERKNGRKGQSGSYAVLLKGRFPDSKEAKYLKKLNIR